MNICADILNNIDTDPGLLGTVITCDDKIRKCGSERLRFDDPAMRSDYAALFIRLISRTGSSDHTQTSANFLIISAKTLHRQHLTSAINQGPAAAPTTASSSTSSPTPGVTGNEDPLSIVAIDTSAALEMFTFLFSESA
ncbi:hypothetical protein NQ318_012188 [Aromia moschata]|uniref:Uncharacterized protein n=1 Tax=Aromia moschata TaxID=1265417 RepID=A0AAV8Z0V1_9CUCU|nr:hypothetical protein NQ318_012188 [Aromia moschata]